MPFPAVSLAPRLISELKEFARVNAFSALYRGYHWGNDTYANGFPDIYCLESRLLRSDRSTGVTLEDVKAVARWGALRSQKRISGKAIVLPRRTLHNQVGASVAALAAAPLRPLALIGKSVTAGIGPTYLSKVLRFASPQEYGAIDTRLVRVFGSGDTKAQRHNWLTLRATSGCYGWYIASTQKQWPSDYSLWINILRQFAAELRADCPHPSAFVGAGLRQVGAWECADVEMALFAYATRYV
jgi:hypothetical protein